MLELERYTCILLSPLYILYNIAKVLSGRDPKCLEVLVGSLSMSVSRNLANIYLQDAGIKSSEGTIIVPHGNS